MEDRVRNIFDMFNGTDEFDKVNSDDYRHLPDAALKFAIVRNAVVKLGEYFADNTSGATGQFVEQKSVLVQAVRRKMKEYAAAARALNIEDAGFRRLFRIPNNDGVQSLIAAGREFTAEIARHAAEFARFGLTAADLTALTDDLDALENAVGAKAGANMQGAGATAGIDEEIERAMDAEIFLDAMMKIVYRNNPFKLAQWRTARHVRRSNRPSPQPAATQPAGD